MPRIIVDTDVFSYIFKKSKEASLYLPYLDEADTFLSFATIGELYFGSYRANWGERRLNELKREIAKYLIIPSNIEISMLYGEVKYRCIHHTIEEPDYWTAACVLYHDCYLATNNKKHFIDIIPAAKLICPK